MQAIVMTGTGGPEVLQLRELPTPKSGPQQLLIATEAAGVAFNDVTTRQGRNPGKPAPVLGFDVVGRILEVGADCDGFAVGDRVAALVRTGGYATRVVAPAQWAVPVPDQVHAAETTALTLNYLTAFQMLHHAADSHVGDSVLVLGAAGGVGCALTELAAVAGIRVLGTASVSRRNILRQRGVEVVQNVDTLRHTVDAAFDPVGGPSLARSRRATTRKGTVVSYGFSHTVDSNYSKYGGLARTLAAIARAKLTPGARLVVFGGAKDAATTRQDLTTLLTQLDEGQIRPEVTTLPLAAAAEAHRRLEARTVTGKLVLVT